MWSCHNCVSKLFKGLEAFDRKPPEKSIVQRVADAYEVLGLLEEKERVLEKYKDLFTEKEKRSNKKSKSSSMKGKKSGKPFQINVIDVFLLMKILQNKTALDQKSEFAWKKRRRSYFHRFIKVSHLKNSYANSNLTSLVNNEMIIWVVARREGIRKISGYPWV